MEDNHPTRSQKESSIDGIERKLIEGLTVSEAGEHGSISPVGRCEEKFAFLDKTDLTRPRVVEENETGKTVSEVYCLPASPVAPCGDDTDGIYFAPKPGFSGQIRERYKGALEGTLATGYSDSASLDVPSRDEIKLTNTTVFLNETGGEETTLIKAENATMECESSSPVGPSGEDFTFSNQNVLVNRIEVAQKEVSTPSTQSPSEYRLSDFSDDADYQVISSSEADDDVSDRILTREKLDAVLSDVKIEFSSYERNLIIDMEEKRRKSLFKEDGWVSVSTEPPVQIVSAFDQSRLRKKLKEWEEKNAAYGPNDHTQSMNLKESIAALERIKILTEEEKLQKELEKENKRKQVIRDNIERSKILENFFFESETKLTSSAAISDGNKNEHEATEVFPAASSSAMPEVDEPEEQIQNQSLIVHPVPQVPGPSFAARGKRARKWESLPAVMQPLRRTRGQASNKVQTDFLRKFRLPAEVLKQSTDLKISYALLTTYLGGNRKYPKLKEMAKEFIDSPLKLYTLPDYERLIGEPIYIKLLLEKLERNEYDTVEEFLSDFDKIQANCLKYNGYALVTQQSIILSDHFKKCYEYLVTLKVSLPEKWNTGDMEWDDMEDSEATNRCGISRARTAEPKPRKRVRKSISRKASKADAESEASCSTSAKSVETKDSTNYSDVAVDFDFLKRTLLFESSDLAGLDRKEKLECISRRYNVLTVRHKEVCDTVYAALEDMAQIIILDMEFDRYNLAEIYERVNQVCDFLDVATAAREDAEQVGEEEEMGNEDAASQTSSNFSLGLNLSDSDEDDKSGEIEESVKEEYHDEPDSFDEGGAAEFE